MKRRRRQKRTYNEDRQGYPGDPGKRFKKEDKQEKNENCHPLSTSSLNFREGFSEPETTDDDPFKDAFHGGGSYGYSLFLSCSYLSQPIPMEIPEQSIEAEYLSATEAQPALNHLGTTAAPVDACKISCSDASYSFNFLNENSIPISCSPISDSTKNETLLNCSVSNFQDPTYQFENLVSENVSLVNPPFYYGSVVPTLTFERNSLTMISSQVLPTLPSQNSTIFNLQINIVESVTVQFLGSDATKSLSASFASNLACSTYNLNSLSTSNPFGNAVPNLVVPHNQLFPITAICNSNVENCGIPPLSPGVVLNNDIRDMSFQKQAQEFI